MSSVKGPTVRKRNRRSDIRIKSQEELFLGFVEDLGYPVQSIRDNFQPIFEDNTFLHMYMPLLAQVAVWYMSKINVDDNTIRNAYVNQKILGYREMTEQLYRGFYFTCESYYTYLKVMLPSNS